MTMLPSLLATMVLSPEHTYPGAVASPLDIRASLCDINGTFLQLLVDMAHLDTARRPQFVEELRTPLLRLKPQWIAARIPFLLVDIEFQNPAWWKAVAVESSRSVILPTRNLNLPRVSALKLARSTLMLAWHLARADRESSLIAMGMSGPVIAQLTVLQPRQMERIGERHYSQLRPRWEDHINLWLQLICGAHEQGGMRAFTLRALSSIAVHQTP